MNKDDGDVKVRPGRIRSTRSPQAKSFLNQVLRAAKTAGHVSGQTGGGKGSAGRSGFGRGRIRFSRSRLFTPTRRVVVKARVVRHQGKAFRSAPLTAHLSYLKREGVTRDGEKGVMFDAGSDRAEDADEMVNLKAFTRDLARQMEADLGTTLDWVAVDHWNTDNPNVHLLERWPRLFGQIGGLNKLFPVVSHAANWMDALSGACPG